MPAPEKPPEYDGLPEWDSDIPPIRVAGFGRKPQTSGTRFEVERGPAKQRGGSANPVWDSQFTIIGDAASIDAFWTFYFQQQGARFAMVDPRRNAWGAFRFVIGKEPSEGIDPPDFTVTFTLERVG
jgi:hypothetical protein